MADSDWDDEYLPNLPRPRFRSPLRHAQRRTEEKPEKPKEGPKDRRFPEVRVLQVGHSTRFEHNGDVFAGASCVLIKGCKFNVLVDTMTAWDGPKLENLLIANHLHPDEIHYVVCTNSRSCRTGCNYLFRDAFHIVGNSMRHGERHVGSPLDTNESFLIEPKIQVICTPGATLDGVSVLVDTDVGVVGITGDLIEKQEDVEESTEWKGRSADPVLHEASRKKVIQLAHQIIPGHGAKFLNCYKTGF